jgi:hypothetical protein
MTLAFPMLKVVVRCLSRALQQKESGEVDLLASIEVSKEIHHGAEGHEAPILLTNKSGILCGAFILIEWVSSQGSCFLVFALCSR